MIACAVVAWALAFLAATSGPVAPGRSGWLSRARQAADRRGEAFAEGLLGRLHGPTTADAVAAFCAAMCAELRAGAAPEAALIATTQGSSIAPRARAAALLGEPIPPALVADAGAAGSAGLAGVAACWKAAAHSGSGLADGLERVAALARAERRVAADLAAETAASQATARILGLLPLMGLLLGELLGAQPLQWLFGSRLGWLCLVGGVSFLAVGNVWARRILHQALPRSAQALR